ncbi:ABC transporter permease subunit [Blastococcus sp. CT_GayMR16]|uniref:ABC transporter permease n=1 Tax=Blastococcus sp. CT_GayMR16 TaxID=2559607 RepID=UPI001072FD65|nr:ABC transporter permease subunit [Blastococcus sp. CT_GayMR16]TFV89627.1 ABC transporter permease subunit [Blastococcus sp. CT_GayMR16]
MTATVTRPAPEATGLRRQIQREASRSVLRAVGRSLLTFGLTLVVVIALWVAVIELFGISAYVAKGPLDVWAYLVTDDDAADHRAVLTGDLGVSLTHAFIGFVAGLVVALLGAIAFRLSRGVEHALMPIAMLLRSVPLIAMAPLIILIFGRDVATVAVVAGIVVLFPALVNIVFGLHSATPETLDVVSVYGGNSWTALRRVALPASLPSFFAAVRISVPGALTGALLVEWLATGDGIGSTIQTAYSQVQFSLVWSAVVVVTAVSLVLYNVVQIVETVVLTRMGMTVRQGS